MYLLRRPSAVSFLCLVVISLITFSASKENEPEYELQGSVLRVEERTFDLELTEKFGERSWEEIPSPDLNTNTTYTTFHRLASKAELDADGDIISMLKYIYNRENELIELNFYDASGKLTEKMTYDRKGSPKSAENSIYDYHSRYIYNANGKLREKVLYKRYKNGHVKSMTSYKPNGALVAQSKLTWDRFGNRASEAKFDERGKMLFKNVLTYDERNYIHSRKSFGPNGQLTARVTYSTDSMGNITLSKEYGKDGKVSGIWKYEYEYDEIGNYTTKTVSASVFKFGRRVIEPQYVTYRKLYYKGDALPEDDLSGNSFQLLDPRK